MAAVELSPQMLPRRQAAARRRRPLAVAVAAVVGLALVVLVALVVRVAAARRDAPPAQQLAVALDQEERRPNGSALTSATQSVNRYDSVLRQLDRLAFVPPGRDGRLALHLHRQQGNDELVAEGIDPHFLVPLLPYERPRAVPDAFDLANLMLAEYARNGVELAYEDANSRFGVFNASAGLLDGSDGEEYFFAGGAMRPNPRVRPKRLAVINNCLSPGLWELAASDSVGEMYHAWFTVPAATYFQMVRQANELDVDDAVLAGALAYRPDLTAVPLDLDRLRHAGELVLTTSAQLAGDKQVGGYSSQDSRRKVQRGFFSVLRGGQPLSAKSFADLAAGDRFALHAFVPPGIYTAAEQREVPYDPAWQRVEIRAVEPRTLYPGQRRSTSSDGLGHVEITVFSTDGTHALVLGNLSVALLVVQEDYPIPAFGAGVLEPSEPIERRYLRLREGPLPHYAYLAVRRGSDSFLVNNHEAGLEQVFLRPFERAGRLFLRITLVSYERIVDVLELEVPLQGKLADSIRAASRVYHPPLYRVYRDDNVL